MKFAETPLKNAFILSVDPHSDERGFFGRTFCRQEFLHHGLNPKVVQANHSKSTSKYTLRGLHYQIAPMQETKIVKCIKGSIFDVIVDIRKNSPTYGKWFGEELSEHNFKMMYVPQGFAHGFITLEDHSEILYFVSEYYSREHERGIRWNDPFISIHWPVKPLVISEKDLNHPQLEYSNEDLS